MGFTKWFDEQSKGIKILLMIPFWGWIFGALYRIFKFVETKETANMIGFILFVIPFIGFFLSIVDLVTIISEGKISILVSGGNNFGITGKVTSDDNEAKEEKAEEAEPTEEVKEEK